MTIFENHKHWPFVKEVASKLSENGYVAYLAGGCVRDALLNRVPNDFDLATDAHPDQVETLFDKVVDVGKSFGVLKIVGPNNEIIDVATFRSDFNYQDGRRPEKIEYSTPKKDASRRDFTINSIFFDMQSKSFIDFFGGQKDIKGQLIKTVGVAFDRMSEDYLRALRAVRFAAQLGFEIENETLTSLKLVKHNICNISSERTHAEFVKILQSSFVIKGINLLESLNYLDDILPCLKGVDLTAGKVLLEKSPVKKHPDHMLFLLLLPSIESLVLQLDELLINLKSLKYSNESLKWFKANYQAVLNSDGDAFESLLMFDKCELEFFKSLSLSSASWQLYLKLQQEGHLPRPIVGGEDLKLLGVEKGPEVGRLLKKAYKKQLLEGITSKKALIDQIRSSAEID